MNVRSMDNLKDKLCQLLEEIEKKGSITTAELEHIFKITTSIKNLDKIVMAERFENSYDDGRGYQNEMSGRRYRDGNSYRDGYRDEMSGKRGYSYANESMSMRDRMESMMRDNNMSQNDKSILREAMNILDK